MKKVFKRSIITIAILLLFSPFLVEYYYTRTPRGAIQWVYITCTFNIKEWVQAAIYVPSFPPLNMDVENDERLVMLNHTMRISNTIQDNQTAYIYIHPYEVGGNMSDQQEDYVWIVTEENGGYSACYFGIASEMNIFNG